MPDDASPGWFSRNWKWVVPVFGLGLPVALCLGFSLVMGLVMAPRIERAQKLIAERALADPIVAERVGAPVRLGGQVALRYQDSWMDSNVGIATFSVPVAGVITRGKVSGSGRFGDEAFEILNLSLQLDGEPRPIELAVPKASDLSPLEPIRPPPGTASAPSVAAAPDPGPDLAPIPEPRKATTEKARPAAAQGALTLVTRPAGEVQFAGKALGKTPLFKVAMPAGTHRLTVVGEDGVRRSLTVQVKANETTLLNLPLEDLPPR